MKLALVLIDFQNDFLSAPGLQPAAGFVVERAGALLTACRVRGLPVVHVWTTVRREPDDRMPHWKASGLWRCEAGTVGHETPESLRPADGEMIVHKQFFSGFGGTQLRDFLQARGCDTLILAGVHLHGCVRATAMDAYERGYRVFVAEDAVASDDAIHAAITRRYLAKRMAAFDSVENLARRLGTEPAGSGQMIEHRSPADHARLLWTVPKATRADISACASDARAQWQRWRDVTIFARAEMLRLLADGVEAAGPELAIEIAEDVGKPIRMARAEVQRSAAILRAVAEEANVSLETASKQDARYRYEPLGVVGIVTPWNNPLAIPVGKIAPALLFGNAVVWKPAPAGTRIARRLLELASAAGLEQIIQLATGDHGAASALAEDSNVDAVTISGSLSAGYALQEICARRHAPFQGELGGNNAAIVWDDADMSAAAEQIAAGAFGFAGQRCTANRRAIVSDVSFEQFVFRLHSATAALGWGDPMEESTIIGPLVRTSKRDEVLALLERARQNGLRVLLPHREQANYVELLQRGAYCAPAIVLCDDPSHEIVQEETFGPVLVIQRAKNFETAIALSNGVRQGLVAALFSHAPALQKEFLSKAQAGVLKLNRSTVDADAHSPLGGWKASGVGPAEHGPSDREFFCRVQTIYGS